MDSVLYIWLGTAAIAPFVTLLSTWSLVVFFSYRRRWRLADVFLCSLTVHEVVFSLFGFGYAVLSMIRPLLDTPCSFIIWGMSACRIFHLSAMTSLLLDRALSSKFPYTYRYSVRKSQVQYHLAVLGIIAVFVGVTAVFARSPNSSLEGLCSLHPLAWNFRFSVFLTSVYGMLLVTGFVCCFTVAIAKDSAEASYSSPGMSWESGRSSSSSNSSKALKGESRDDEWKTVAAVCWLSYLVNHVPFLCLNVLGLVSPSLWSLWMDNVSVWMSLAQGSLSPMLLLLADAPHRSAVRNMLRQPGRIYRHLSDSSGFLLQVADVQCTKNGVPTPTMMMYPSMHNVFRVPHRIRWTPTSLPSLQSLNLDKRQSATLFCSSDDSLSRASSRCRSPVPPLARDIYSSLDSSCYTLLSLRSSSSRMSSRNSVSSKKPAVDDDAVSITTNALDDFEFHGGQKSGSDEESSKIFSITQVKNVETLCCKRNNNNTEPSATENRNKKTTCRKSEGASFFKNCDSNAEMDNDLDSFGVYRKKNVFGARYGEQFIPDFSSNNLVFLSSKPLQARSLSVSSSEIRNTEEKTVTETPQALLCLEHSAIKCFERPSDSYAHLETRIPTSNGSIFTFPDHSSPDQRLIIYSEYL